MLNDIDFIIKQELFWGFPLYKETYIYAIYLSLPLEVALIKELV